MAECRLAGDGDSLRTAMLKRQRSRMERPGIREKEEREWFRSLGNAEVDGKENVISLGGSEGKGTENSRTVAERGQGEKGGSTG